MPLYKIERSRKISQEEMQYTLRQMNNDRYWQRNQAILALLYITGCRISELLDLQKQDFIIKDNYMEINILTKKLREKVPIKTRRTLTISMNTPFINYVFEYLNDISNEYEKMFPISRYAVNLMIKKHNTGVCPHMFRHNRMQQLAEVGLAANQLQSFAGWKHLSSASFYIHISKKMAAAAKDVIE